MPDASNAQEPNEHPNPYTNSPVSEAGSKASDVAMHIPAIVDGLTTELEPEVPGASNAPTVKTGDLHTTFNQAASHIALDDHILTPGGSPIVVTGTTIRLASPQITDLKSNPGSLLSTPAATQPHTRASEDLASNPSALLSTALHSPKMTPLRHPSRPSIPNPPPLQSTKPAIFKLNPHP